MPYRVEILDNEQNRKFLKGLPPAVLPKMSEHLNRLGKHPYLGRSVEAPIPVYLYSFKIRHARKNHNITVSYKINENNETILITAFGRETANT